MIMILQIGLKEKSQWIKMKKKILRQAMIITIKELRKLADELEKEGLEQQVINPNLLTQKWNIAIINKKPKCCDTWEIEKMKKYPIKFKKNKKGETYFKIPDELYKACKMKEYPYWEQIYYPKKRQIMLRKVMAKGKDVEKVLKDYKKGKKTVRACKDQLKISYREMIGILACHHLIGGDPKLQDKMMKDTLERLK